MRKYQNSFNMKHNERKQIEIAEECFKAVREAK